VRAYVDERLLPAPEPLRRRAFGFASPQRVAAS